MGIKSRGCFSLNFCVKADQCENCGIKCDKCIRYNCFIPKGTAGISRKCMERYGKKRYKHE